MIFVFKTNALDDLEVKKLHPLLQKHLADPIWNFDLEDCDKILRIDSQIEIAEKAINLLQSNATTVMNPRLK